MEDGLLSEEDALRAYRQCYQTGIPFVTYLAQQKLLNSLDIAQAAPQEFGIPLLILALWI